MVMSFAKRSASRTIRSKALRRISPRSRGFFAAHASKAPAAASIADLASSTLALATEAILFSVAGSITSKRAPSDDLRHWPPIHRSVGTLASRLSYMAMESSFAFLRRFRIGRANSAGEAPFVGEALHRGSDGFDGLLECPANLLFSSGA